jgi:acyl-CoA synthetase (AMP-forming)/AMP-acid ligase II
MGAAMNRFLAALQRNIAARPDDVFCHFVDGEAATAISWGALGRRIGGFAAAYRARGPAPGGIVPIFLRHDPALFPSFFAAMLCGLAPSFLPCPSPRQDPAIYWDSLRHLLAHLDPALMVLDRATLAEMRDAGLDIDERRVVSIDAVPTEGDLPAIDAGEDSIALLQHSSGTTGWKKGVALPYRAIAAQLDSYGQALDLRGDDCIVSWLPLYHDMGLVACLLLPAYSGVPFVQLDPFQWVARPEIFFAAIAAHRGTLAWLPNFAFEHLAGRVREPPRDLSSMRAFINCSEPCRPQSFARFAARFAGWGVRPAMLQSCYAMAETVFAVTQTPLGAAPRARDGLMNLGRPLDGIAVSIRDPGGDPLLDGEFGEIALQGAFLFDGYYRDPALTAARLRGGWYYSRDRGCVVDGDLYVAGRLDDVLIVNGRNLHAHEVEALVDALGVTRPGRAAAFALYDDRAGTTGLIVAAERDPAAAPDDDAIAGRIVEQIRSTVDIQPRDVRLVPPGWVVKTSSGKIARGANERKYRAEFLGAQEPVLV